MSAEVLTLEAARKANFEIIENGRGTQAVHDAVVAMQANRRTGSACTKTKAQVAYSGKKPWRQKGTGRARAGFKSSVVWRGGGVVFGPKPRDYSKKLPKAVKRLAFRKAISSRILDGDVLVIDEISLDIPKTKQFIQAVRSHTDSNKVLVVAPAFTESTYKSARNVEHVLLMTTDELNTEHLLRYDKILIVRTALEKLAERTTKTR